jgi:hypothetical protein
LWRRIDTVTGHVRPQSSISGAPTEGIGRKGYTRPENIIRLLALAWYPASDRPCGLMVNALELEFESRQEVYLGNSTSL